MFFKKLVLLQVLINLVAIYKVLYIADLKEGVDDENNDNFY